MCGIVGVIFKKNTTSIDPKMISEMCEIISHRGPDDHGVYVNENVALGHRRLSIIDLASGHQPMTSPNQRYTIVFNGEIYNYQLLKRDLQSRGTKFNTNSDTEVILTLYQQYGKECVKFLNGIFAFCIYDNQQKVLFLARDHAGVKPLYYYNDDNYFIFASEIKSILKSNLVQAKCNNEKITEYFIFRDIAGTETLFKNIYALAPGNYIFIENNNLIFGQYWDITQNSFNSEITVNDAYDKLSLLLSDAIKSQMMSDVPLGTFCSGGVDSSLVTAIAALNTSEKINTYSVGFNEQEYDESKYAKIVSRKYETNHHELRLNNSEFSSLVEKSVWQNDLPLNFANSVLIYALSRLAKKTVTVVLTGEGADELFGGYPRYMIPAIHSKLSHIPAPLIKIAKYGLGLTSDHRAKKLASFLDMQYQDVLLYNSAALSLDKVDKYGIARAANLLNHRKSLIENIMTKKTAMNAVSTLDQETYLLSILNRQDKMSMAASIESRVPILDYRLIEFANSLPDKIKCTMFKPKHMFKKLAEKYLPKEVIYRQKSGFGVPLEKWFANMDGLGKLADEVLTESCLDELQWNGDIRKIITEHKNNVCNHADFLWSALNYVQWKSVFNVSI